MTTYRTLVEAQAFHRRRLVTAFVSGREHSQVEPARPGRSLLAGAALAVLLMVSARIAGVVTLPAPF